MRLSHRDFDALQRVICELYEYRDLRTFRQAVPELLLKIIPADYFISARYQFDPATGNAILDDHFASDRRLGKTDAQFMQERITEHPFTRHFMNGGEMTALKFSDFLTCNQFQATVWHELAKRLDIYYAVGVPVSDGGGAAGITLTNRHKDFTERDRMILNMLRSHYDQAYRNARLVTDQLAASVKPLAAYGLTSREAEIAHWLAQGKTNSEIAIILHTQVRTVEKHMEKILGKLDAENRTMAAITVARERWKSDGGIDGVE